MANNSQPRLSIIIPAYNEAKRISQTLQSITDFLAKQPYSYEIIIVNDGSSDKTVEVVEKLALPHVAVKGYGQNRGKGYAVHEGMMAATGQYLLMCDADNSTSFEHITEMLKLTEQYPVVIGSRKMRGSTITAHQPLIRTVVARGGNLLIRLLILPGITDTQCGFKLFEANAARAIFAQQTIWGWGLDMEILFIAKRLGYKIKQIPVQWTDKPGSKVQSPLTYLSWLGELLKIKLRSFNHYRKIAS